MADRQSAALFGQIFELLAENITEDRKELALKIFEKAYGYDFDYTQMEVDDDILINLGLAKLGINPEEPEYGETLLYYPFK